MTRTAAAVGVEDERTASGLAWMVTERSRISESGRCLSLTWHRSSASSVSKPSMTLPKTESAEAQGGQWMRRPEREEGRREGGGWGFGGVGGGGGAGAARAGDRGLSTELWTVE